MSAPFRDSLLSETSDFPGRHELMAEHGRIDRVKDMGRHRNPGSLFTVLAGDRGECDRIRDGNRFDSTRWWPVNESIKLVLFRDVCLIQSHESFLQLSLGEPKMSGCVKESSQRWERLNQGVEWLRRLKGLSQLRRLQTKHVQWCQIIP